VGGDTACATVDADAIRGQYRNEELRRDNNHGDTYVDNSARPAQPSRKAKMRVSRQ